jgi:hypothetical protein
MIFLSRTLKIENTQEILFVGIENDVSTEFIEENRSEKIEIKSE